MRLVRNDHSKIRTSLFHFIPMDSNHTQPFYGHTQSSTFKKVARAKLHWPPTLRIGKNLKSLISGLLTVEASERLGYGGASDVMLHPWLSDVDWDKIQQRQYLVSLSSPFVPCPLFSDQIVSSRPHTFRPCPTRSTCGILYPSHPRVVCLASKLPPFHSISHSTTGSQGRNKFSVRSIARIHDILFFLSRLLEPKAAALLHVQQLVSLLLSISKSLVYASPSTYLVIFFDLTSDSALTMTGHKSDPWTNI